MTILRGFVTDLMIRISVYHAFGFWETACELVIMRVFFLKKSYCLINRNCALK